MPTNFPTSADFPDNSPAPKSKIRQFLDAINERFSLLASPVAASRVVVGNAAGTSFVQADASNPGSFGGGDVFNFLLRYGFYKRAPYGVVSNAVALAVTDGAFLDVTLNGNVLAEGIALTGLASNPWSGLLRVAQDATGGRTIGGGATLNAGFAAANFDFCGYTIAIPSAAGKGTIAIMFYPGSGKTLILPFATPS